ncbi:MAG: glutamate-1-semialdehyde-2,1-aminomutase [Acidobacteria bacterium]|nr:MAG: glutamate-1-semialdehyde-2,1-aminomutase [Acidobacteriota bacterium]PIE91587.1 MAG: glutamate-1-semialdehyde-2,1-aminomutase [Acidobacteriota bacterium]
MNHRQSEAQFDRANRVFPGGVNSPVRAFKAVGGKPPFIEKGFGAHLVDVDGNQYIDYVLSWGPLILGHAPDNVVEAITETAKKGTSFGAPCPLETQLGQKVGDMMPQVEMLRFVNSGTEATMSALRLARGFTGRNKVIKFEGNYHGHADDFLIKAGSGIATLSIPGSPGVPAESVIHTLVADFNDLSSVQKLFDAFPKDIAAVIIEPVSGNMGMVPPEPGFLEGLRDITAKNGALLIFDEVMTGFRVHLGGAHTLYRIKPDLITLGKVIGGGLPVGAYGGRRDIMLKMAPEGPVYQAGTLSGNPLAMAAGLETLSSIQSAEVWRQFDELGRKLTTGLKERARKHDINLQVSHLGSMFGFFFSDQPVRTWKDTEKLKGHLFSRFHSEMLKRGVYLAPSQFESGFLSTQHSIREVETTLVAADEVFGLLKDS